MHFGVDEPGNTPSEKVTCKLATRVPCQEEYQFSSQGWGSKSKPSNEPFPILVGTEILRMGDLRLKDFNKYEAVAQRS